MQLCAGELQVAVPTRLLASCSTPARQPAERRRSLRQGCLHGNPPCRRARPTCALRPRPVQCVISYCLPCVVYGQTAEAVHGPAESCVNHGERCLCWHGTASGCLTQVPAWRAPHPPRLPCNPAHCSGCIAPSQCPLCRTEVLPLLLPVPVRPGGGPHPPQHPPGALGQRATARPLVQPWPCLAGRTRAPEQIEESSLCLALTAGVQAVAAARGLGQ